MSHSQVEEEEEEVKRKNKKKDKKRGAADTTGDSPLFRTRSVGKFSTLYLSTDAISWQQSEEEEQKEEE
jgi:hypothetical protein